MAGQPGKRRGLAIWPWQMSGRTRYISVAMFAAVVLAFVLYAVLNGDDDDDQPGDTPIELCDMLADPRNHNLTTGDIRRLTDFRQDELERYVAARCPEHLARISK